jgi:hypothetical protein
VSADNWKQCPKCVEKSQNELTHYIEKLSGVGLTLGEVATLVTKKKSELKETLREDYEIYSEDFVVYVTYSCHCTKCGFSASMEFEQSMES